MSFNYAGTNPNGLMVRLGHVGYLLNSLNEFVGNTSLTGIASIGSGVDEVFASYSPPDANIVSGIYSARDQYRTVHNSFLAYLQSLAQSTTVQMVNEYAPLPSQTVAAAVAWLVKDMTTNTQSVLKPTVSATVANGAGNTGGGVLLASVIGENGVQKDYVLPENITAQCTKDAQQGGATAGQEVFTLTSPVAETNALLWDYPLGSALKFTANAVDALADNSGGNLLQNGSWKTWSTPSSGPDNWLILSGAVGTDIIQSTGSDVYKGYNALAFEGTNSPAISQPFNTSPISNGNQGGTSAKLLPQTIYCVNFWLKVNAVPAAGVLTVDLTDGSNSPLVDQAGTPNSLAVTLSTATTGWVPHSVFFRTPAVVPSTGYRLRLRISTPMSAGTDLFLSHLGMTAAVQTYQGGPRIALFSGSPGFIQGDYFTLTTANNYQTAAKWQFLADRLFNMRALGLQLPSVAAAETIADTLIS